MKCGATAILAAVLVTGCGTVPASVIDLRREARVICVRTNRSLSQTSTPASPSQVPSFLARGIAHLETELARLQRLRAPRDVADVYSAALAALTRELDALRATGAALRQGEDPVLAVRDLQQRLGPLIRQANDAWTALQIPACLQG